MYIKLYFLALVFYFLWNKSEILDEMFYSSKAILFVKFFLGLLILFLLSLNSKFQLNEKKNQSNTL